AGGDVPPAVGRAAAGRVDGEDGRGFRPGAAARHAAGRRPGRRHRPAGDVADRHDDDPGRDPVPAVAAGGAVTASDAVNLDTSGATGFVAEGSAVRGLLKAYVQGRAMLMCATAEAEFLRAVRLQAGPFETARAARFLAR